MSAAARTFKAFLNKPRTADGYWLWRIERRLRDREPDGPETVEMSPVSMDHPTHGQAPNRAAAVEAARAAANFYLRQDRHDELDDEEEVSLG